MTQSRDAVTAFWETFLRGAGLEAGSRYVSVFSFDLTPATADKLLDLVLRDVKQATCSSVPGCMAEMGRLPRRGDRHIVLDGSGNPACVIETTSVRVLPFHLVTWELCRMEGEDRSLESWQQNHRTFLREEGRQMGYPFFESMPVVFETFRRIPAPRQP